MAGVNNNRAQAHKRSINMKTTIYVVSQVYSDVDGSTITTPLLCTDITTYQLTEESGMEDMQASEDYLSGRPFQLFELELEYDDETNAEEIRDCANGGGTLHDLYESGIKFGSYHKIAEAF
jgi:hypothetical protein